MKRSTRCAVLLLFGGGLWSPTARADFFGGDLPILAAILTNAISQLQTLGKVLGTGSDTLSLLQAVNQGLNDALLLRQTLGPHQDPGIYGGAQGVGQSAQTLTGIYGAVPNSPLAPSQLATDQTTAEGVALHNDMYAYADQLDEVGQTLKLYSHTASPGRAQKLTVESLGVLIHVMNQELRATSKGVKLQAQALAVQNKREKDGTQQYLTESQQLSASMQSANPTFNVPRF